MALIVLLPKPLLSKMASALFIKCRSTRRVGLSNSKYKDRLFFLSNEKIMEEKSFRFYFLTKYMSGGDIKLGFFTAWLSYTRHFSKIILVCLLCSSGRNI